MPMTLVDAYKQVMKDSGLGIEVFENPQKVYAMMRDIVEDNTVWRDFDLFYKEKGIEVILEALSEPEEEQRAKLSLVKQRIMNSNGTAADIAASTCNAFAEAIGMGARIPLQGSGGNSEPESRRQPRRGRTQSTAPTQEQKPGPAPELNGTLLGATFEDCPTGLILTGYKGLEVAVNIPDAVNGRYIVAIGPNAFSAEIVREKMIAVRIPASVTLIGKQAFKGCKSLTRIEFAPRDQELVIETGAFSDTCIDTVSLPAQVREVPEECFKGCSQLTSCSMAGAEVIGENAFEACYALSSVIVSMDLQEVGNSAFAFTAIERIDLPACNVGDRAFQGCSKLKKIEFLGQDDGEVTIGVRAFAGCLSLTQVSFPNNVIELGDACFKGCERLTAVKGNGVKKVGYQTFADCASLRHVEVSETALQGAAAKMVFEGSRGVQSVPKPSVLTRIVGRRKEVKV